NRFTERHLRFFYREVLLLKERDAIPDQVHLVFDLAKQITSSYLIEAETIFKGGKDRNGAEILFSLENELIADQTKIKSLHSFFIEKNDECGIKAIHTAQVANSADGLGEPIEEAVPPSWKTLGGTSLRNTLIPYAEFGFAIASPVLDLREGLREVLICIKQEQEQDAEELTPYFDIFLTTEDGWLNVKEIEGYKDGLTLGFTSSTHYLGFKLPSIVPAITPYNEEVHQKGLQINFPLLYLQLKGNRIDGSHPYQKLHDKNFSEIEITVKVNEITSLVANNINGLVDVTKPFMPFGPTPTVGTEFYVGSSEAFQKKLTNLGVIVKWDGLQLEDGSYLDFKKYYEGYYTSLPPNLSYYDFQSKLEFLNDGSWLPVEITNCDQRIVTSIEKEPKEKRKDDSDYHPTSNNTIFYHEEGNIKCSWKQFCILPTDSGQIPGRIQKPILEPYTPGTQNGFIRFTLSPYDFKHLEYPKVLTRQTLAAGKLPKELVADAAYREKGLLKIISGDHLDSLPGNIAKLEKIEEIYDERVIPILHSPESEGKLLELKNEIDKLEELIPSELAGVINRLEAVLSELDRDLITLPIAKRRLSAEIEQIESELTKSVEDLTIDQSNYQEILSVLKEIVRPLDELSVLGKNLPRGIEGKTEAIIPNPPFTPVINNIFLNYSATASTEQSDLLFFHIHPFEKTFEKVFPLTEKEESLTDASLSFALLPQFQIKPRRVDGKPLKLIEGALYIGLEKLIVPNTIPLLFQLAEGTANPDVGEARVSWAYLKDNEWVEEEEELEILGLPDPTLGLVKSGIVQLSIPAEANTTHTILADGLHWLRVAVDKHVAAVSEAISIHPQAAKATFLDRGRIHIGIRDIQPGEEVELSLQLVNPEGINSSLPLVDSWYYLRQNEWRWLDTAKYILNDETEGLRKAGKLLLKLPTDITDEDTLLTEGFFWFRVDIFQQSGVIDIPVSARTPQVSIQFSERQSDFERLVKPLPMGSLNKPLKNDATLKSVTQYYPSFGGKIAEKSTNFYTRVSEHLRHKGRGIALFDYERLILDQFPEIFRVKCIRHMLPNSQPALGNNNDYTIAPGFVTIAVIPSLINKTFANPFQPKADLSVLKRIEQFLQQKISPFVNVCVLNPMYESIRVSSSIAFREGFSPIFYKQELAQEISRFLAPWAFDDGAEIVFGGKMYASSLIQFIEKRRYVDFVKDFRIDLGIVDLVDPSDPCQEDFRLLFPAQGTGTVIKASNVRSVLTSSGQHEITEFSK
ncbi:MAG: hypothetical protein AAGC85_19605, partial [Bacteroidota bacterium]